MILALSTLCPTFSESIVSVLSCHELCAQQVRQISFWIVAVIILTFDLQWPIVMTRKLSAFVGTKLVWHMMQTAALGVTVM